MTGSDPTVPGASSDAPDASVLSLRRLALNRSSFRNYAVLASLVVLFVVLSFTATNFFTGRNILNILDQATTLGIIASAGTLVIIGGCFDLSVGAIFTMSGVIAAEVANHVDPTIGILAGILSGAAFGLANGIAVSAVGINPFIATLATQIIIRGLALAITGGFLITVSAPSFMDLGADDFLGAKLGIWILLGWVLLMGFLLAFTVFGRYVRACGGNEEAARLSGLRVGVIRATTFVVSGLAASLAGVIAASRIATGEADVGVGLELTAVAAIVVGGTSIRGGQGAIWRTIVGVLLLSVISNGFDLLNINTIYEQVVYGGIILVAVGIDAQARAHGRAG